MVTMQEVANYAGVSLATVSRVVNGRGVSPKLSKLVTVALDELGYRPNALARALTTKKNSVIGVIISQSLNQNPLITAFLSHLLVKMSKKNKPLIIIQDKDENYPNSTTLQTLVDQRCEGIIYVSLSNRAHLDSKLFKLVPCDGIPMVIVQSGETLTNSYAFQPHQRILVTTSEYSVKINSTKQQPLTIDDSINLIISVFSK